MYGNPLTVRETSEISYLVTEDNVQATLDARCLFGGGVRNLLLPLLVDVGSLILVSLEVARPPFLALLAVVVPRPFEVGRLRRHCLGGFAVFVGETEIYSSGPGGHEYYRQSGDESAPLLLRPADRDVFGLLLVGIGSLVERDVLHVLEGGLHPVLIDGFQGWLGGHRQG